MAEKTQYVVEECRFCGNKTHMDIKASYIETFRGDFDCDQQWLILKCAACEQISFALIYSGEDTMIYDVETGEHYYDKDFATKYPVETYQRRNVPIAIHKAFETALKAKHLDDNVCLIALRRTLEIVCKEQGEIKGKLTTKIKNLSLKGILPPVLDKASHVLRLIANEAVHGDGKEYDINLVNELIHFTQIIIEYIYVLPSRLESIERSTKKSSMLIKAN